jgi:hypothetical protein
MPKKPRKTNQDTAFYERIARELDELAEVLQRRPDADQDLVKRLRDVAADIRRGSHP